MGPFCTAGKRFALSLAAVAVTISAAYAQTPPASPTRCVVSAQPNEVRAEGFTERMGDLQFLCSGINPGAVFSGYITVFLPVEVTNRIDTNHLASDVVVFVDYGTGSTATNFNAQVSANSIAFPDLSFTAPATGEVKFTISGIRGNVTSLAAGRSITASLASSFTLSQSQLPVAFVQKSLYATLNDTIINCKGSQVPSGPSAVSALFAAQTAFFSTRITEGFGTAFQARGTGEDNGTRFLVKYAGFPADAQLFVPDFIAGSDAAAPTSAGDMGFPQSGGQYVTGSGSLLLVRVSGADATGTGGTLMSLPSGSGTLTLNSSSPVTLTGGSGYVVYEAVDSALNVMESAQFPTFIGVTSTTSIANPQETVTLAPLSTDATASADAPLPRFQAVTPASDCTVLGDCGAAYFPRLDLSGVSPISMTGPSGENGYRSAYIRIVNAGGGIMNWSASVTYQNGSGWLTLGFPNSGQNDATMGVFAYLKNLAPGTYQANVAINAGSMAGSMTVPITLTVTAPVTPPSTSKVNITSVVNAATFLQTPMVPGGLGTLMGTNLSGNNVTVKFNGVSATLLYTSATQINFQVPAALTGISASVVVVVDGDSSAPVTVPLSPAWPAVFNPGVLNQDNTVNLAAKPAKAGTVVQIFATGIPEGAGVTASIGNSQNLIPGYAGPAPGIPGVQQVNLAIPASTAGPSQPLVLCATFGGQQYCSSAQTLWVQ
jgi:uncharacterized protein (TIGR03437 family)